MPNKIDFPIFKTKIEEVTNVFNLSNPQERRQYFQLKAGKEIEKLRQYLERGNTFIAYLLGKKNSGKGTYSKLFMEIVDSEHTAHISIGDIVRFVHQDLTDKKKKEELLDFLKRNYRGYISIEEAIGALEKRNTKTLLPSEFILALVKREINKLKRNALFIDGFPRDLDQVSYSLFFRDLVDYREDPDIFILVNVPETVINERIKYRRVCPICQTPRNLKLLTTGKVGYDENQKQFYLMCDNPACRGARMISKEGDELGIEPIRERLKLDERLMEQAFSLYGIPKVLLRNSVPQVLAEEYVDKYEITPEYTYRWNTKLKKAEIIERPWVVQDDQEVPSYSLLPPPVVVSMIKQMAKILCP